jgi:hypothetical protein
VTALQLFARKGPEEPVKAKGLCQSSACYISGREDFLFQRGYNHRAFIRADEQHAYHCGWAHEELDLRETCCGNRNH